MSSHGAMATWSPAIPGVSRPRTGAPGVVRPGAARRRLQLTRRGRLVVMAAAVLGLLMVLLLLSAMARAAVPASAGVTPTMPGPGGQVVVAQGDSLWAIAESIAPERDPRETVREIRALNGLESNLIHPGQVLSVPAGG